MWQTGNLGFRQDTSPFTLNMEKLLDLGTHLDNGRYHHQCIANTLPNFQTIQNRLNDFGLIHEQVEVVGDHDRVAYTAEPVDGFHRIADFVHHAIVDGVANAAHTVPCDEVPFVVKRQQFFRAMGLLGQHAQRRVSGFEVVFDHGESFPCVGVKG